MINTDWSNPYITNKATKGYFHFWPEYPEKECKDISNIEIQLTLKHPKFKCKAWQIYERIIWGLSLRTLLL